MKTKLPITLRGLIREEGDYWVAQEITWDIYGTGDTFDQALACMLECFTTYHKEGGQPRRAPLFYVARYWWARLFRSESTFEVTFR